MTRIKEKLNETIVNGSKVYIDNGEIITVLNEDIQNSGYMSVEELSQLLDAHINNLEKMYKGNENNSQ